MGGYEVSKHREVNPEDDKDNYYGLHHPASPRFRTAWRNFIPSPGAVNREMKEAVEAAYLDGRLAGRFRCRVCGMAAWTQEAADDCCRGVPPGKLNFSGPRLNGGGGEGVATVRRNWGRGKRIISYDRPRLRASITERVLEMGYASLTGGLHALGLETILSSLTRAKRPPRFREHVWLLLFKKLGPLDGIVSPAPEDIEGARKGPSDEL